LISGSSGLCSSPPPGDPFWPDRSTTFAVEPRCSSLVHCTNSTPCSCSSKGRRKVAFEKCRPGGFSAAHGASCTSLILARPFGFRFSLAGADRTSTRRDAASPLDGIIEDGDLVGSPRHVRIALMNGMESHVVMKPRMISIRQPRAAETTGTAHSFRPAGRVRTDRQPGGRCL
jgi:hypothetical protein